MKFPKTHVPLLTSVGIDLSTSATGVVVLRENPDYKSPTLVLEEEISHPKLGGIKRNATIVGDVMALLFQYAPDRIVLEGYSLNLKNKSSIVPLIEIGGLLRFMMQIEGMKWLAPEASLVKKFASGKGNVAKEVVMMKVFARWGHESKTNNTADAYVCAVLGLAHAGRLPAVTLEQRVISGGLATIVN
jgi:crossover junction endodeoxyribonuclease RuvC